MEGSGGGRALSGEGCAQGGSPTPPAAVVILIPWQGHPAGEARGPVDTGGPRRLRRPPQSEGGPASVCIPGVQAFFGRRQDQTPKGLILILILIL
eukprot:6884988-Pyramimonas_sp.AAC.1